jgi:uncharacterized integral membrane protein
MGLEDPSDPKKQKPFNSYLKYSSLAMQMVVTIGVAAWIGYKADLYFEFKFPLLLLTLTFAAFGGIMYKLYRSINKEE